MEDQCLINCPNPECKNHHNPEGKWFNRKGTFIQRWSGKSIPRFQCKACGLKFSMSTFMDIYRQHKPYLNRQVFKWYSNSASQRQIAENISTTRTTVIRKFRFLADKARRVHACQLVTGQLYTPVVQFDEQETFVRTKKLPLSIAIAVDGTRNRFGGKIIDIDVGTMPAKSRNARSSQEMYGYQPDERPYICQTVLNNVKFATGGLIRIVTDAKTAYKTYVAAVLPNAIHFSSSNEKREYASRFEDNPLWWVNQACAANRHDMSRLRRRTCVTTKNIHELRRHLWLYVAHRNKYEKDLLDPFFDVVKFKSIKDSVGLLSNQLLKAA